MRQRHALFGFVALVVVLGAAMLTPTGRSRPVRVEPRRHSPFHPAYIAYTFTTDYPVSMDTRRPVRMYYVVPIEVDTGQGPGLGDAMLTHDELLEHYRVSPEQLERVPTRMPSQWLSGHWEQLME